MVTSCARTRGARLMLWFDLSAWTRWLFVQMDATAWQAGKTHCSSSYIHCWCECWWSASCRRLSICRWWTAVVCVPLTSLVWMKVVRCCSLIKKPFETIACFQWGHDLTGWATSIHCYFVITEINWEVVNCLTKNGRGDVQREKCPWFKFSAA